MKKKHMIQFDQTLILTFEIQSEEKKEGKSDIELFFF
jgi:hypothetical protein